ncbi:MAG: glutamate racemase [Candidatus Gastranaerophilales bacterium]|nr:glutamate racemase [Candidatus Gastranaerophilales bacterium]
MNNCPIGIFDSGVGGLSVFSQLFQLLPNEDYIYFGDTLNLPYGNKTKEQLIEITESIFDFFKSKNVKAVVMACNTTSATAYATLKSYYNFKIYPVVQSVSKCIADENYKKIGVFATNATINAHAYKNEIQKYNPNCIVYETACPEWVNIVENELQDDEKSIKNIKLHVDEMLSKKVEKIVLGCTHYPYLTDVLSQFAPPNLFINPAYSFVRYIINDLKNSELLNTKRTFEPKFYVSSNPKQFISASKLFYNVDNAMEISLSSKVKN